jgi:hypothetical protein
MECMIPSEFQTQGQTQGRLVPFMIVCTAKLIIDYEKVLSRYERGGVSHVVRRVIYFTTRVWDIDRLSADGRIKQLSRKLSSDWDRRRRNVASSTENAETLQAVKEIQVSQGQEITSIVNILTNLQTDVRNLELKLGSERQSTQQLVPLL